MLICIDPGHGGKDPGAVGPGGTREADINLAVALQVRDILCYVAETWVTRSDDTNAELSQRAQMANDLGADVFVSIHCNAVANPAVRGMEVWTSRGRTEADRLADLVGSRMKEAFPDMPFRADFSDGDLDREAGFYVLRYTSMPAVLVEMDFISSPIGEQFLSDPGVQEVMALAIARGVADFLGVALPAEKPVRVLAGGKSIECVLSAGRVWTPVRDLAEALGHKVEWYELDRTVMVK